MLVFAHVSDPHLTTPPWPQWGDLLSKRLPGYVAWRRRRNSRSDRILEILKHDLEAAGTDHVVVTGDLTNLGSASEHQKAVDWLGSLGPVDRVSVVPGNHDCYVCAAWAETLGLWQPWMRSDDAAPDVFPYIQYRGPVAFIGLSSAVPTALGLATGRVGRSQRQRLVAYLNAARSAGYFRAVLVHHSPHPGGTSRRKCLTDGSAVRSVLAECGAELVLHGHAHGFSRATVPGPDGGIPVLGAPGATGLVGGWAQRAGYYRLTVRSAGTGWTIAAEARSLEPSGDAFRALPAFSAHFGPGSAAAC